MPETVNICVVIPAYKPRDELVGLVRLLCQCRFTAIIVVNDGSDRSHDRYFSAVGQFPDVHILRHAFNLGKGAALKTGLNYAACNFPDDIGVVTADADGQHQVTDIARVAEQLESSRLDLVLGSRQFTGPIPFRSQFGNTLTRSLVRMLIGYKLGDTQTGLRGIPGKLIPSLLRTKSNGYEFELDMILLCRSLAIPIREVPIQAIYLNNNESSHFNPLLDSMRIYFVLFRFAAASMATTMLDFAIFTIVYLVSGSLAGSLIAARAVAVNFNYLLVRKTVFNSKDSYSRTLPRYLALTVFSGAITYLLIRLIVDRLSVSVVLAKACAEMLVFFFNFAVQREIIFAPALSDNNQ